jgi:hypothetical protein
MRRHSLDPDNIKRQIKSVFTSPTRKFLNFTTNNSNTNGNSFINFARRRRRFSVPEKKYADKFDINPELHTIHEVSRLIFSRNVSACSCLLCCSICMSSTTF